LSADPLHGGPVKGHAFIFALGNQPRDDEGVIRRKRDIKWKISATCRYPKLEFG